MTQAIIDDTHAVQTGVVLIPLNKLKKSSKNARKTPHERGDGASGRVAGSRRRSGCL
jgi:hypothetical protein